MICEFLLSARICEKEHENNSNYPICIISSLNGNSLRLTIGPVPLYIHVYALKILQADEICVWERKLNCLLKGALYQYIKWKKIIITHAHTTKNKKLLYCPSSWIIIKWTTSIIEIQRSHYANYLSQKNVVNSSSVKS